MADTRTLTITLGAGNFQFVDLIPARTVYAAGETVKVTYRVKNVGSIKAGAKITVTDTEAAKVITTYTIPELEVWSVLNPYTYLLEGATVGTMPDKDWKLEFKLEP